MNESDTYYKQLKKELHNFMENHPAVINTKHRNHKACMKLIDEAQAQIREWSESRACPETNRSNKKKKSQLAS